MPIAVSTLIPRHQTSTLLDAPPGMVTIQSFGVTRGLTVRTRNAFAMMGAGFQAMGGGRNDVLRKMCEDARVEAFNFMVQEAASLGANGILGIHYESCEIEAGITEVLCYGTAVLLAARK